MPSSARSNQIEINHRPAPRRGLHQLRVLERGRAAAIRDRRKSLGVCRLFSSAVRTFPAADLGMDLLAVGASDPVVDGPAVLLRRREVACLDHIGHRRHRTRHQRGHWVNT